MIVTTLGTGSPLPDPNRAGPATLVQAGGKHLLFDAGRGVLMRLAGAMVAPGMLDALLLTHLHSDHTTDVNDVITTRWIQSFAPLPLTIVGPEGTAPWIDRTMAVLTDDVGYRLAHHEDLTWQPENLVTEARDGVVLELDGVRVIAKPTDHAPVHPTVGYRIEAEGKAVAIAGDTIPCAGLDELCAGADVYVQTAIRADVVRNIPVQRFTDILDYHSSVEDAARTAARHGVRTLVLTHPVPAPPIGQGQEWVDLAAEHFDGEIVLAEDMTVIEA
ncbi:MAG: hypothetical protein RL531_1217 [Actinomycetota bacterium]|jgi:ribonuclease Z